MVARVLTLCWALLAASPAVAAVGDALVDQRIVLASAMRAPCLSVQMDPRVVVSVPDQAITDVLAARPARWQPRANAPESERMAHIQGTRAQALSQLRSPITDALGCRRVSLSEVPGDALFLLDHLLQAGRASVAVDSRPQLEPAVLARETTCAQSAMGARSYRLEDGHPFFLLVTCIV